MHFGCVNYTIRRAAILCGSPAGLRTSHHQTTSPKEASRRILFGHGGAESAVCAAQSRLSNTSPLIESCRCFEWFSTHRESFGDYCRVRHASAIAPMSSTLRTPVSRRRCAQGPGWSSDARPGESTDQSCRFAGLLPRLSTESPPELTRCPVVYIGAKQIAALAVLCPLVPSARSDHCRRTFAAAYGYSTMCTENSPAARAFSSQDPSPLSQNSLWSWHWSLAPNGFHDNDVT